MERTEEEEKDLKIKINNILSIYAGTHKFHNFTSKLNSTDPSVNRYMRSFHCESIIKIKDQSFCVFKISGQSFLLHQIRKMFSLAIWVMRTKNEDKIKEIMNGAESPHFFNIPKAPGFPLILLSCNYNGYDEKWANRNIVTSFDINQPQVNQFKETFIYSNIHSQENGEKGFFFSPFFIFFC